MTSSAEHEPPVRSRDQECIDVANLNESFRDLLFACPSRAAADRIAALVLEHGLAAALYLLLPDVNPYAETLADNFADTYVDTYNERQQLIDDTLDAMGWREPVQDLLRQQAIPADALVWNTQLIWRNITDHLYDIVELDGSIYVFAR